MLIDIDLHFSCGHSCDLDHQSQLLMDSILEMERPDFIVFNGDLVQRYHLGFNSLIILILF